MGKRLDRIKDWEALARAAKYEPGNMAALCPISLRQLERYFLLRFKQTPGEWVRHLRCRLARELVTCGYSNKAIAIDLHFGSESHLCHEFKKVYGVSPQTLAPVFRSEKRAGALAS
jgi:AraC family transcriptional regulator